MSHIEIVDVAPRDGLQSLHDFVPTERKVELIRKLASAGFQRMEVTSFVSPSTSRRWPMPQRLSPASTTCKDWSRWRWFPMRRARVAH